MDQSNPPVPGQLPPPIPSDSPSKPPWYKSIWFHTILFLFLPYVQMPLMWILKAFSIRARLIITALGVLWIATIIIGESARTDATHEPASTANKEDEKRAEVKQPADLRATVRDNISEKLKTMNVSEAREYGRNTAWAMFDDLRQYTLDNLDEVNEAFGPSMRAKGLPSFTRENVDGQTRQRFIQDFAPESLAAIRGDGVSTDLVNAFAAGFAEGCRKIKSGAKQTEATPDPAIATVDGQSQAPSIVSIRQADGSYYVNGTVLSVTDDGVLVTTEYFVNRERSGSTPFLVRGHFNYVDGDRVSLYVVPDGTYRYKTALGSEATVRAYKVAAGSEERQRRGREQAEQKQREAQEKERQRKESEVRKSANVQQNRPKVANYERSRKGQLFLRALLDRDTGELVEQVGIAHAEFAIKGGLQLSGHTVIDLANKDRFVDFLHTFLDWCEKSQKAQLPKFERLIGEFDNHFPTGSDEGHVQKLQFGLQYDPQFQPVCKLVTGDGASLTPQDVQNVLVEIENDLPSLLEEARSTSDRIAAERQQIDAVLTGQQIPGTGAQNSSPPAKNSIKVQQPYEQIIELVNSWAKCSNGNDPAQEASLYANPVDYLDEGILQHEQLLKSLVDDRRKFPYQHYRVTTEPQFQEMDDGSYQVTFQFDFDRLDAARKKHRTGTGTMDWTVVNDESRGLEIKRVRTEVSIDKQRDQRSKADAPPKWLQKIFGNPPPH